MHIRTEKIVPLVNREEIRWLPDIVTFNRNAIFDNGSEIEELLIEAKKI